MSIPASLHPRLDSRTALWAVGLGLFLALNGFLGLLALSFLDPAPVRELTAVSQRLQDARSDVQDAVAVAALDGATSQLYAAQRAIAVEQGKSWRLRSYDRARGLISTARKTLDGALASLDPTPPPSP